MGFSIEGAFDASVNAANEVSDGIATAQATAEAVSDVPEWVEGAIEGAKESAKTAATAACSSFLGPAGFLCGEIAGEIVGWFAAEVFPAIGAFLEDVGKELKHFFQCTIGGNCPREPSLLSNAPYLNWIDAAAGHRPTDLELQGFAIWQDYIEIANQQLQIMVLQLVWLAQQTPGAPPGYTEQECLKRLKNAGAPLVRYGSAEFLRENRWIFDPMTETNCSLESFEFRDYGPEIWGAGRLAGTRWRYREPCPLYSGPTYWWPSWVESYERYSIRSEPMSKFPGFKEPVRFDPFTTKQWIDQIWQYKVRALLEAGQREGMRIVNAAAANVSIWMAAGAQAAEALQVSYEPTEEQRALVWLQRWGWNLMSAAEQDEFAACVNELGGWKVAPDAEVARCRAAIAGPTMADVPDGKPGGSAAVPLVLLAASGAGVAAWKLGLFSRLARA